MVWLLSRLCDRLIDCIGEWEDIYRRWVKTVVSADWLTDRKSCQTILSTETIMGPGQPVSQDSRIMDWYSFSHINADGASGRDDLYSQTKMLNLTNSLSLAYFIVDETNIIWSHENIVMWMMDGSSLIKCTLKRETQWEAAKNGKNKCNARTAHCSD